MLLLFRAQIIRKIEYFEKIVSLCEKDETLRNLCFFIFLFYLMSSIADFVNSVISNHYIDSSIIQNAQGCLDKEMKVDGWILLALSSKQCIVLKCNIGESVNLGFLMNDEKVLKVFGSDQIGDISHYKQSIVEGIVDLDHGSRFEGMILTENKFGIPFGYGEMYDDDGILVYKGITINWKRFGYGTSYHNNGCIEYEGYWCDDKRFGIGKVYNRKEVLIEDCVWYNGTKCDICEGDGSEPMNLGIKHLKLTDNCVLVEWDVSWFLNLESIEIGNNCFGSVTTFKIDGLNRLKTIIIGSNSFTQVIQDEWIDSWNEAMTRCNKSKSFHILNCESLESIQIGEYSFSDYAGDFELTNLPQLQAIQIGSTQRESRNFHGSSFVIRGIELILNV